MKYSDKLKDPRWQQKRLKIFERDGWKCMGCGEKDITLNVHHIFYLPKTDPWNVPDGLLITLCETCHKDNEQYADIPSVLINCIASVLDEIWRRDKQGDCITAVLGGLSERYAKAIEA